MRSWNNTEEISRKIVLEACIDRNAQHGDLLENRFLHMMNKLGILQLRPLDKAQWKFEKQFRCADAQWTSDMTRRALLLPLEQLSS